MDAGDVFNITPINIQVGKIEMHAPISLLKLLSIYLATILLVKSKYGRFEGANAVRPTSFPNPSRWGNLRGNLVTFANYPLRTSAPLFAGLFMVCKIDMCTTKSWLLDSAKRFQT